MLVCDICKSESKVSKISIGIFFPTILGYTYKETIFAKDLCQKCLEKIKEKIK